MLLQQASAGDELTTMVVNGLRKYAPVLEFLHFFKDSGGSARERKGDDIDGTIATRSIGEDFAAQTVAPVYGDFALKLYGKNVKLDVAYEERGGDVPSEMKLKLENWSENAGRSLMKHILNGDPAVDAEQTTGIKKHIANLYDDGDGDTTRIVGLGTNGLQVTLGNSDTAKKSHQNFVEGLGKLIGEVEGGADCLLMDFTLLQRLSTIAADQCQITMNQFGVLIGNFRGVPVVPTWREFDGTLLIPYNETVGTSTDCTSVYAFKSGEKKHLTAMTTKVGCKVYPMEKVANFYQHHISFQMDLGMLSNRCVAKLEGIRLG